MEIKFVRILSPSEQLTKFDIYINGTNSYYAESKQFALTYTTCLYTTGNDDDINFRLKVKKVFSLLPHFHITLLNKQVLSFKTISFRKGHFQCIYNNDTYDLYYFQGNKCAIYLNDIQIAYLSLSAYFDNNMLYADNTSDYELLMAFALIMDRSTTIKFRIGSGPVFFPNILYTAVGRAKQPEKQLNRAWLPR